MKRVCLICFGALSFAWGCSKEEPAALSGQGEYTVPVEFRLEADPDTDTSLEPMTRATTHTQFMENGCRMLFLKRDGQRWIVDTLQWVKLDASEGLYNELKLTGGLPPGEFRFEMRPGDYRVVAVLNGGITDWNASLTPGTVVFDGVNPVPYLFKYRISSHYANPGFRMLNREIFVAVAEITVPKRGDLHAQPMAPVSLKAERRVCKVRFLLKDVAAPEGTRFRGTAYTLTLTFRGVNGPLVGGVDALGDSWYGGETLYELSWRLSTNADWYPSEKGGTYHVCRSNSTVFSPFLLVDPNAAEFPVDVTIDKVTGQNGEIPFRGVKSYRLSLAANRITGLIFQPTDQYDPDEDGNYIIALQEVLDEQGLPENPAGFFDQYFEWYDTRY